MDASPQPWHTVPHWYNGRSLLRSVLIQFCRGRQGQAAPACWPWDVAGAGMSDRLIWQKCNHECNLSAWREEIKDFTGHCQECTSGEDHRSLDRRQFNLFKCRKQRENQLFSGPFANSEWSLLLKVKRWRKKFQGQNQYLPSNRGRRKTPSVRSEFTLNLYEVTLLHILQ